MFGIVSFSHSWQVKSQPTRDAVNVEVMLAAERRQQLTIQNSHCTLDFGRRKSRSFEVRLGIIQGE